MLAATTSINGRLGADNTDAVALFAQLMPTLAGNIATAIEFVYDRVPTLPGSTFAAIILLFHCRGNQKFFLDGFRPFLTFFSGNYGSKFSKNCKKGLDHSLPGCAVSAPRLPESTYGGWEPAHYARQDARASAKTSLILATRADILGCSRFSL